MDKTELAGAFVVIDLDCDDIVAFLETEEKAKSEAARLQRAIIPGADHDSFAVYRLDLVD